MILLDTDICVEILRGNHEITSKRKQTRDTVAICFMTVAELYYGAEKSTDPEHNREIVEMFLASTKILNTDLPIMQKFGELKGNLAQKGKLLPDADLFIASTTLCYCTTLITGNIKHYNRIPNLNLENWLE